MSRSHQVEIVGRPALGLAAVCSVAASLLAAATASATTFCVPAFHAACPNSGGNVAQASVETAMQTNGSDGTPDTVLIAAQEIINPDPIQATGTDPLTIQGAGPDQTTLTTPSTGGNYVLNLITGNTRTITVKDLKIAVPASEPAGGGAGAQISGDTLENVDIVSRNPDPGGTGSAGVPSIVAGGTFRDVEIRPEAGGTLGAGISTLPFTAGTVVLDGVTIRDSVTAVSLTSPTAIVSAKGTNIVNPALVAFSVSAGTMVVQNSTITTSGALPLIATANSVDSPTLVADHVTAVNTGPSNLAGFSARAIASSGDVDATMSNSILRGYDFGHQRTVFGGSSGEANLTIRYSNVPPGGSNTGAGTLDVAVGNISADPLFTSATDFRLLPGSPSIDAGDPASGGLATDFLGALRPADGDDDGIAVRDQGAFERQAPPPDTTPPDTTITKKPKGKLKTRKRSAKVKVSFSSEAGATFKCKLDKKPFKPCTSPFNAKAKSKGGRGKMHKISIRATDQAGNVETAPATAKFKVIRKG